MFSNYLDRWYEIKIDLSTERRVNEKYVVSGVCVWYFLLYIIYNSTVTVKTKKLPAWSIWLDELLYSVPMLC